MLSLDKAPQPATPVEQRSWPEIGKWFAVHVGRWAVIGGVMYATGSMLLDKSQDVISVPVAEQGAMLNTTLEDKGRKIDEVAKVAKEVDEQIADISADWKYLKEVLKDELAIDIDEQGELPKEESAQAVAPETTTTTTVVVNE